MRLPILGWERLWRRTGRIYASLVKGKLTWPDPSELAQSDTAMREAVGGKRPHGRATRTSFEGKICCGPGSA